MSLCVSRCLCISEPLAIRTHLEHIKQQRQRAMRPPCDEDQERHPKQQELDAEVDCEPACNGVDRGLFVAEDAANKPDQREEAVGSPRDDREEEQAEPFLRNSRRNLKWFCTVEIQSRRTEYDDRKKTHR